MLIGVGGRMVEAADRPAATCRDRGPPQVALVVSGGVSLGAYQAGFLHYYTEYLKRLSTDGPSAGLAVATGASAGSVNTSLAAFELCRQRNETIRTEDSLFFRTWHDLRIESLFPGDGSSVRFDAILDRAPLERAASNVEAYLSEVSEAWRRDCATDFGFVTTRLRGRKVPLRTDAPSLTLNRMTEKFVMRLETASNSGPRSVHLKHFLPEALTGPKLWLRPGKAGATPSFGDYRDVLLASTAFPIAFSPVEVTFHESDSSSTEAAMFIDGGVFENVPVRLAATIVDEQRKRWPREQPGMPRPVTYVVLSTDVTSRQLASKAREDETESTLSLPGVIGDFALDFLTASRAAELLSVVDENKNLQSPVRTDPTLVNGCDRIEMPARSYALASDHLLAFLGFLDENFRSLDFYLGMLDARRYVSGAQSGPAPRYYTVEDMQAAVRSVDGAIDSERFACLRKVDQAYWPFERDFDAQQARALCGDVGFEATQALLKVLSANVAMRQRLIEEGMALDDSRAFGYFIAALDERGFDFTFYREGGVVKMRAAEVPGWLRGNLDRVVGLLARKQPTFLTRLAASTAFRMAANSLIEHADPPAVLSLGPNANRGLDVTYDIGLGRHLQHRIGVGARVRGLDFVSCAPFCISAFGAVEYRYSLGDALGTFFNLEFGLEGGAGYLRNASADYPAWLVGGSITATSLHRVYLRADLHWVPKVDFESGRRDLVIFGLGLGVRFHDVRALN